MGPSELLLKWSAKAKVFRDAHYAASVRLRNLHYMLGFPTIILSAVVGTAVFATLEKSVALGLRVGVGCISVAAAILAALQTFLRFAERAELHRQAFAGFDSIVRDIELALALGDQSDVAATLRGVSKRFNDLGSAPELSWVDQVVQRARTSSPVLTNSTLISEPPPPAAPSESTSV